ncbi:hypothetical protein J437_LFUL004617 [Ladona fulva]|uniref:Ribosomal protein eL8/eL30/eS12/Gadd45 domain-containing protein n=1 Tax=Ladona fulva TaxID=123851 RepID=A0A8K0K0M7_LADFU|nr:hypothetical protein J437_LFUL004617 [Ladona fulva]
MISSDKFEMEKMTSMTYSERLKVDKSRQRCQPRKEAASSHSETVSTNRMDDNSRKSKYVDPFAFPTSSDSCNAGLEDSEHATRSQKEEKKLAFKLYCKKKKEEAKKEKQRKKEETMLKKIVGPKGESISVINRDMFHKISSAVSPTALQTNNAWSIDSFSFPDLSQGLKRTPRKSAAKVETSTAGEITVGVLEKVEDQVGVSTRTQTKSRKKKDPVVVDILKAIESVQTVSRITGNILDSSNPLRHRGKKREVPKQRSMTRLKKAIMLERERRRALRDISKKKMGAPVGPDEPKAEMNVMFTKGNESEVTNENPVERLESTVEVKLEQPVGHSIECNVGDMIQEDALKEILDVDAMVREKLHSKKFREYCNHSKRQDLSEAVTSMLQDIIRFQDRVHINQPIKAEMHRRYVLGLRQTNNLLVVQKVKIIIMASDIEKVPAPGGLDDIVTTIVDRANKQNVPVIFNFPRRQLGKLTYRKVPVSCIAILNYHGTEVAFQKMTEALEVARKEYHERFMAEKSRIVNELGIQNVQMEKADPEVKTVEPEPDITYPLLKRLTEAISELSVQSSHNSDEINGALSLKSSVL